MSPGSLWMCGNEEYWSCATVVSTWPRDCIVLTLQRMDSYLSFANIAWE